MAVVVASCIASAPTSDAAAHFPTEPSAVVVASCIASAPTPYPGAPTGMAAVVVALISSHSVRFRRFLSLEGAYAATSPSALSRSRPYPTIAPTLSFESEPSH